MHKVIALLKKDVQNGLRNQLFQYMLIAPIAMMVVFRIMIPLLEDHRIMFVVDDSIPSGYETQLSFTSQVERVSSRAQLDAQILQTFGTIGVTMEEETYQLIFNGNEEEHMRQRAYQLAMIAAEDLDKATPVAVHSLGVEKSPLHAFLSAILILLVGIWAGIAMGLTVVYDKETGMIRAQAISPITITHYCLSKILFTMTYTILFGIVACWVMLGVSFPFDRILMIVLASSTLGVLMGMIVGWIADNQNTAIAVIKVLAFLFGMLPMLSMMITMEWEWLFYILPSFWVFRTITDLVSGVGEGLWSFVWAMLMNCVAAVVLIPMLTKKLGLRVR